MKIEDNNQEPQEVGTADEGEQVAAMDRELNKCVKNGYGFEEDDFTLEQREISLVFWGIIFWATGKSALSGKSLFAKNRAQNPVTSIQSRPQYEKSSPRHKLHNSSQKQSSPTKFGK